MKFIVTPELTKLVYQIRRKNKITCKSVSAAIRKSPSYISKFENMEIKGIEEDELIAIFKNITRNDDFYNETLPFISRQYTEMFGSDKLFEQLWLLNYDIVRRPIEVPSSMVAEIKREMESSRISCDMLYKLINSNSDAPVSATFPKNELVLCNLSGQKQLLLIWVEITQEDLLSVLDEKNSYTHYYILNSIVYSLIRRKQFENRELSKEEAKSVLFLTNEFMKKFGVISYTGYTELIEKQNDIGKQENIVTSIRSSNHEILEQINALMSSAADIDLLAATRNMDLFRSNLAWDQGFMFKIICMPYHELDPISYNMKQQFLKDLEKLLQKYKHLPYNQKTFETYE